MFPCFISEDIKNYNNFLVISLIMLKISYKRSTSRLKLRTIANNILTYSAFFKFKYLQKFWKSIKSVSQEWIKIILEFNLILTLGLEFRNTLMCFWPRVSGLYCVSTWTGWVPEHLNLFHFWKFQNIYFSVCNVSWKVW
jgi:hypothetical protein